MGQAYFNAQKQLTFIHLEHLLHCQEVLHYLHKRSPNQHKNQRNIIAMCRTAAEGRQAIWHANHKETATNKPSRKGNIQKTGTPQTSDTTNRA